MFQRNLPWFPARHFHCISPLPSWIELANAYQRGTKASDPLGPATLALLTSLDSFFSRQEEGKIGNVVLHGVKRSQVYVPSASSTKEKNTAEKAAAKGQRLSAVSVAMSDTQGRSKGDLDVMAMKAVEMLDKDGEGALSHPERNAGGGRGAQSRGLFTGGGLLPCSSPLPASRSSSPLRSLWQARARSTLRSTSCSTTRGPPSSSGTRSRPGPSGSLSSGGSHSGR